MFGIGIASSDFGYNPRDAWWGVPRFGSVELSVIAEHFRKLREVHFRSEALGNRNRIVVQPVRGKLHAIRKALIQVPQESPGIGSHALPNAETRNQLGISVNRNVNPLVANFGRVSATNVAPFLLHESPYLIALNATARKGSHPRVHHCLTAFSGCFQQGKNRVLVQACQARDRANAHPLKHHGKRLRCGFRIGVVRTQLRSGFGERCFAGSAAPALNAALAGISEPLGGSVVTSGACHVVSPLALCEETSQNSLGSEAWVTPRFGLAPTPVSAEAGALIQLLSVWWRSDHGLLPAFLKRPVAQGVSYLRPKSFAYLICRLKHRIVIVRRSLRANPAVGGISVSLHYYDLASLKKAHNYAVKSCHRIAVFLHVVVKNQQTIPDVFCCDSANCALQHDPDGISKAKNIQFLKPRISYELILRRECHFARFSFAHFREAEDNVTKFD